MTATVWQPGTTPLASVEGTFFNQLFIATVGQTEFTLTDFVYEVGTNSLQVYRNGSILVEGLEYIETATNSFTLISPANSGAKIYAIGLVGVTGEVVTGDGKVKVNGADSTSKFLVDKLSFPQASVAVLNPAGDEVLEVTFPEYVKSDGSVPMTGELMLVDGSPAASLADVAGVVSGAISSGVKQSIQYASVDSSGYNNALYAIGSSSLKVGLRATAEDFVISYSDGLAETLDTLTEDSTDLLGTLAAWKLYYVYKNKSGVWGTAFKAPQYDYAFDRNAAILTHFDGADSVVACPDAYGNVVSLKGVYLMKLNEEGKCFYFVYSGE
jgi:hypothetical protein